MYLTRIIPIVMATVIVSFSLRTIGTIFPQIFADIILVKATILINVLFILSLLLFWMFFYVEYISPRKASLKKTCLLALIGTFAVSVIFMKEIPFTFGMNVRLPRFIMNPYFDAFVPLLSSVLHLVFFLTFLQSLEPHEKPWLHKPILSMTTGIFIFIVLHCIVLFHFLTAGRFQWLEHMNRGVATATVPLVIAAAWLILYFYYRFNFYLNSCCNDAAGSTQS